MIGIHPIHRRLAELHMLSKKRELTPLEWADLTHCIKQNATLVLKLDWLKELSVTAYAMQDTDWQHEICAQTKEIERTLDFPVI